jgi:hypothetical protein
MNSGSGLEFAPELIHTRIALRAERGYGGRRIRLAADTPLRLARALLCLAVCGLAAFVLALTSRSEPAGAAFPGPSGRIIFTGGDDNGTNPEIYSMRPDGSGRDNITEADGTDDEAAWSADGTKIAFMSSRDGDQEIYTMDADGSNQVNRTESSGTPDSKPAWSPDGTKIAFTRGGSIWVMNANGTGQDDLSSGSADDSPAWSPDGTKIAFSRGSGLAGIYVMDADGTDPPVNVDSGSGGSAPSWSPDGTKIAFVHPSGGGHIYVTNANGSGSPTPVETDPGGADEPAWSPDGTKIAFESSREGYWEIFSINVDGTGLDNLTNNDAQEYDDNRPDWGGDFVAPSVTITTPPDGASYALGEAVVADYACSDAASGLATCTGPVADGAALDTTSSGAKKFTVTAADNGGTSKSVTHGYMVRANPTIPDTDAPGLEVRAKRRQRAGRKIRVKLTSDEGALALAGGKVVVKPPASGGSAALKRKRRFKLKSIRTALVADETTVFKLRPKGSRRKSRRTRRKIRRLVLDGNRAKARVKLSATDAAGNEAIKKIKIKLVR